MDTLDRYRDLIERVLKEHARIPYAHGDVQRQTVFDRSGDHYLLVLVGRDGRQRVHGCLVHVDLIDGKFWIQRGGTEYGVARELLDAGVPREHIVLAFRSEELRKHSGCAVA